MSDSGKPSASNEKREVLVAFIRDETCRKAVRDFAESQKFSSVLIEDGDIKTATEALKKRRTPLHLIVELPSKDSAFDDIDALAEVCEPDVKVILVGSVDELKFYQKLMDIGVTDYLLKPLGQEELERALNKSKAKQQQASDDQPFKVFSVIGARGGVGVSTIASTLGMVLSGNLGIKTAVVDLDPQFGTLSLDLDLEPSRGFREALEKPDRIDSMFMDRVLIKQSDMLSLLSAEEAVDVDLKISDTSFDSLFAQLEVKFKSIVFELPRVARKMNYQALMRSDYVVVVSEPSVSSLRDAMRINDLAAKMNPKARVINVLNKVGLSKKFGMSAAGFAKNLKREVDFEVPFVPDVYGFANAGKPLGEAHKTSKLFETVVRIAGIAYQAEPAVPKQGNAKIPFALPKILGSKR